MILHLWLLSVELNVLLLFGDTVRFGIKNIVEAVTTREGTDWKDL